MAELTADLVRNTFDYVPETGRLVRVRPGLGAQVGREIGALGAGGHRRTWFAGRNRMTAHLVWLHQHGSLPTGILRHVNLDNSDDRIANLAIIKKPLQIAYVNDSGEVRGHIRLERGLSGIYEIFCMANGRRYVGSAVDMDKRWVLHHTQLTTGKHHSKHLQRAWNKHGEDAFVFRILQLCEREFCIAREQHYIDTLKPEFNSRPDAASQLGFKPTEESRAKMSAARAGKSSAMKGRKHSEETKAKISANRKGKCLGIVFGEERRRKISDANKGRVVSEEQRQKISATLLGTSTGRGQLTPEQVLRVRELKSQGLGRIRIAKLLSITTSAASAVIGGHAYLWVK